ncbi:MAG: hypothetical protein KA817_08160 [Flavobacteriales bacterium]|nr:hypothetical protein [Flavobacteriales bacterium]
MKLPILETRQALREMGSTGHHPVQFVCSDENIWFCKYVLSDYGEHQTDLLYYELIGCTLLRQLGISTPAVALVKVMPDSFTPDQIPNNAKDMLPGVVAFGSKRMFGDIVDDLFQYRTASELNKLTNPEDLIRIALFDLWVANMDRGKELEFLGKPGQHNYNLLTTPYRGGHRLVPIDHASILGNSLFLRDFSPDNIRISVDGKLFGTRLFQGVWHHLGATKRNQVLDEFFLTSVPSTSPDDLFATLDAARPYWPYPPDFDARLRDFLWNADRLARVEAEARTFFNHPKP